MRFVGKRRCSIMHALLLILSTITWNQPASSKHCGVTVPPRVKCCPKRYKHICCTSVPICDQPKNRTSHLEPKPCRPNSGIDCEGGFVGSPNGTVIPCPGGLYSPAGARCAIPCLNGGYCPKTQVVKPVNASFAQCISRFAKCCRYSNGDTADVRVREISGRLRCAGISNMRLCPESFYCPNATVRVPCINPVTCPAGSEDHLECNLFKRCVKGEKSFSQWVAILVLLVIFIFILLLYTGHSYRRDLKRHLCKHCHSVKSESSNAVTSGLTGVALQCFAGDKELAKMNDLLVDIAFSGINVEINGTRILSNVFGSFRHGNLSAIMGPSGCGKTTLLNILRGKVKKNVKGTITFNNVLVDDVSKYSSIVGFAPQDDVMHASLTVKEVLQFVAHLHAAQSACSNSVKEYISEVMALLGLSSNADDLVGGDGERGISGGQKRRLNLGMELVTNPTVLFCDEPTSGLDSSTSLEMIRMLRNVAMDTGINIVCVIHQPRTECFSLFHEIFLLSTNGKVIYDGETMAAQSYFESLGFDMNQTSNPADFIIDIANGTSVSATCNSDDLPKIWIDKCGAAATEVVNKLRARPIDKGEELISTPNPVKGPSQTWNLVNQTSQTGILVNEENNRRKEMIAVPPKQSWLTQLVWFYKREFVLQVRSIRLLVIEVAITVVVGGILGSMYVTPNVYRQVGKLAMTSLCAGMLTTISFLRYFSANWNILLREADAGINRFSYFLSISLLTLPAVAFIFPLSFLSLYHTISDTRSTFCEHYVNMLCVMFASTGISHMISTALSPSKMHMVAVGVVLISAFVGGSSVSLCDLNKIAVIGPALYSLSFSRWFIEGQYETEVGYYSDMLFMQTMHIAKRNNYTLQNRSVCLSALIGLGLVTRLLAFIAILIRTR